MSRLLYMYIYTRGPETPVAGQAASSEPVSPKDAAMALPSVSRERP